MKLELEKGLVTENATAADIAACLQKLDEENLTFAIMSERDAHFIQTFGTPSQGYILEYQDGGLDQHFRSTKENLTIAEVIRTFQDYATGSSTWKAELKWKILDFKKMSDGSLKAESGADDK